MADRPILMSGPMVRALLDGRKTQTRRLAWRECDGIGHDCPKCGGTGLRPTIWQSVKPGDRLWCRETFLTVGGRDPKRARVVYAATNDGPDAWVSPSWSPSIHMPRWASRLTLLVTATRMERVQEISEADARAEGLIFRHSLDPFGPCKWTFDEHGSTGWSPPSAAYAALWQSLHTKPGARWEDDPEVVVLTFKPYQCNIEGMG